MDESDLRSPIGIAAALASERRWISDPAALVEISGVGFARAERAATRLVENGAVALVSWGLAGGLDPRLSAGTLVLPSTVLDENGSAHDVEKRWRDRLLARVRDHVPISTAVLQNVPEVVAEPAEKAALRRRSGAAVVDMESSAVGRVAAAARIPWIVVRVIFDSANARLAPSIFGAISDEGRLHPLSLARFALRPRQWPLLAAMRLAHASAARTMRKVWSLAGPDLAFEGDPPK